MAHSHDHSHHGHAHTNNQKILWYSFLIISGYMVIEAVGGVLTNSLALLSDAGHMLSDAIALGIALLAFKFGSKQANANKTFGYQRFEILAAALNGLTLILVAVWVIYEAIGRFVNPLPIQSTGMLIIATIGLIVNIVVAWMMFKGGDTEENLNMRGAFLHVLGDLLGSVAAIIAALAVKFYGWAWADPLISVLVSILILKSGYGILKEALHVLMEGTPKNLDMDVIRQNLLSQAEIANIHDLHLWSITSGQHVLTCHLVMREDVRISQVQEVLHRLEKLLQAQGVQHVTLQAESLHHGHDEAALCSHTASQNPSHSHDETTHEHSHTH
ncbi:cation diffusion facilitator family transporter [Vitreoscilla stercoraria]|uniref:Cation diffusion facilitator family transporter n=1 Tax=Vitreoscilla stercoraria TaxID=61 RepID=A0ABY4EDA5_VITST|nr:cation diffusion facilitator family transporter [Vitreoscilla stercoraria]UOO92910.1 cation diffusion facilitator family transporter [Vitreoscilla stercoraria]